MLVESLGTNATDIIVQVSALYPTVPMSGIMPLLLADTYQHNRETSCLRQESDTAKEQYHTRYWYTGNSSSSGSAQQQ